MARSRIKISNAVAGWKNDQDVVTHETGACSASMRVPGRAAASTHKLVEECPAQGRRHLLRKSGRGFASVMDGGQMYVHIIT
jgi:hypothetical protein